MIFNCVDLLTTLATRLLSVIIGVSKQLPPNVMRKIEMEMNSAIRYRRNFSKANTSVRCFKTNGITTDVDVFLHGNHIASLDTASNQLTIKDGGWQSVTTKSRLNALLDEFAPSMGIFQKDWVWYLSDRLSGSVVPFISGMTV